MIFYLKAEVYTALTSSTPILRIIRFPNNADVWEECYLGIGYFTASQLRQSLEKNLNPILEHKVMKNSIQGLERPYVQDWRQQHYLPYKLQT